MWQRWRDGGVLFSKTFPDQTSVLAANDVAREFAEDRIREIVDDPAVAEDLIPTDHPIGTKRICTDAGYYATFNRDNVRLVNLRREPIEAIAANGVRTSEATYACDVLVFATGFDALTGAMTRIDPMGPDGHRLSEIWADGPVTFLGVMVPRLPNLFSFSGPGSPSVLANMVLHAEVQVDWAVELIVEAKRRASPRWSRVAMPPRRGRHTSPRPPSGRCSRGPSRRGTWAPTSTARSGCSCRTSAGSAITADRWMTLRRRAIRGWFSRRDEPRQAATMSLKLRPSKRQRQSRSKAGTVLHRLGQRAAPPWRAGRTPSGRRTRKPGGRDRQRTTIGCSPRGTNSPMTGAPGISPASSRPPEVCASASSSASSSSTPRSRCAGAPSRGCGACRR